MKAARQNALKNFDPTKEWKAWLSTIARRVALDEARKLREIPIIITEEHHEATPDRDTPEQQLHLKRETTRLMNALEDLPDEQRQALEASYGSDQSNSEAAAELKIPIGTLKSRISSAKKALGDRMDV
jgi:RNA polymerase sigma-70 factor (ECF subfamily)